MMMVMGVVVVLSGSDDGDGCGGVVWLSLHKLFLMLPANASWILFPARNRSRLDFFNRSE